MITKLPHILAVFTGGCISLLSLDANAQDDGYPHNNFQEPTYQELNLSEDKALIYEPNENRPTRTIQSLQRDSLIMNAAKKRTPQKTSTDKKEDDALSFNFLYYIIQKYKISDIVDQ
jgi:hypothetical protein